MGCLGKSVLLFVDPYGHNLATWVVVHTAHNIQIGLREKNIILIINVSYNRRYETERPSISILKDIFALFPYFVQLI